jgi:hypothetical protein
MLHGFVVMLLSVFDDRQLVTAEADRPIGRAWAAALGALRRVLPLPPILWLATTSIEPPVASAGPSVAYDERLKKLQSSWAVWPSKPFPTQSQWPILWPTIGPAVHSLGFGP